MAELPAGSVVARLFLNKEEAEEARQAFHDAVAETARVYGFPAIALAVSVLYRDGDKPMVHVVVEGAGNPKMASDMYEMLRSQLPSSSPIVPMPSTPGVH